MKKYVFMFLLSLISMVSMARDSIVTAQQRCQIEARDKAELLVPITPTYLEGVTATSGWDNNWFVEAKGGTSAFIGTPIGCGDLFDRVMPVLQIGVGKWFTPAVGGRIGYQGIKFKNANLQSMKYQFIHADFMYNLTHSLQCNEYGLSYTIGKRGWKKVVDARPYINQHNYLLERYSEHSQQANANNNIEAQSTDKNNYSGLNSLRYRMSLENENNDSSLDSLSQKTKVTIGVPIYFYFKLNTAKLVDKTQLVNLDEIAKIAKEQNLTIHISGAADKTTGSDKRNRHLSIERAKYICKQLMKRGVDKDAMKAASLGGIEQFLPKEANRFGVVLLTQ